jgi:hypothetical protein
MTQKRIVGTTHANPTRFITPARDVSMPDWSYAIGIEGLSALENARISSSYEKNS